MCSQDQLTRFVICSSGANYIYSRSASGENLQGFPFVQYLGRTYSFIIGLHTLFNVITKLGLRGFLMSAERRLIYQCVQWTIWRKIKASSIKQMLVMIIKLYTMNW